LPQAPRSWGSRGFSGFVVDGGVNPRINGEH
jgi:hypothetical protein